MPASDLPDFVEALLWEYEAGAVSWAEDRDFIAGRVLAEGRWQAVSWLRAKIGDEGVRKWIERHRGRGLSPRQLRFWETILRLSHDEVSAWIEQQRDAPGSWAERVAR